MNSATTLEVFVSLSIQVSLLVGVAAWVTSRRSFRACADAGWLCLHVSILLLTAAALLFPHFRWVTWADLQPATDHPILDSLATLTGEACSWVWFTGTAVFLAICAAGIYRATSLVRRAKIDRSACSIDPQELPSDVQEISVETRVSDDAVSPFCWQLHRPVIVLPEIMRVFPAPEQSAILRHERAHLRLQHPLHLFLQRMTEALFWFHPLVWWASRRAAACREFRCDQDSVRSRSEVIHYLRGLLRMIELKLHPAERLPAGLGFMGDASLLTERVHRLQDRAEYSARPQRAARGVAAIAISSLVCSLVWLPVNPDASRRSMWSPWPTWSARTLYTVGVVVRDYEVDGHRLSLHNHDK